jgi:hypothetical protein
MTIGGAYVRLLLPSLAFFLGFPFLIPWRFESLLVGAGICALAFPWLVIIIIRVVRLLSVEPPTERRGFDVMPTPPRATPAAG